MVKFVAAILCCVFLLLGNRAVLPSVEYALLPQVYAKLCENKDKPAMKCQGQCQKMKAIAKALNAEKGPYLAPSKSLVLDESSRLNSPLSYAVCCEAERLGLPSPAAFHGRQEAPPLPPPRA
jgi:hypothetical protein